MKPALTILSRHGKIITITLTIIYSGVAIVLGIVFGLLIAKSPCSSSPCQNSGTCFITSVLGDYNCICATDFVGTNCETKLPCASITCNNGGTKLLPKFSD